MPKEIIKEWPEKVTSKPRVEVRWGSQHNDYVEICVDRGDKFRFLNGNDEPWYTGLTVTISNEFELSRLIKVLQKAKRQTTLR